MILGLAAVLSGCGGRPALPTVDTAWSQVEERRDLRKVAQLESEGHREEARLAAQAIRERETRNWPAWWREIRLTETATARAELDQLLVSHAEQMAMAADRASALALRANLAADDIRAETLITQALEEWPRSGLARAVLAERLEKRGDHARAFAEWREAAFGDAPPDWMWPPFAASAHRAGDTDAAWLALERCVRIFSDDYRWFYDLGTMALDRDQPSRAYELLERAHEMAPTDLDVLLNFSTSSAQNGRVDQARELLEDALRLNPDEPQVHFNLGVFYADHQRDREKAIRHFHRHLELTGEPSLRVERWIRELEASNR